MLSDKELLLSAINKFGTPLYLYDGAVAFERSKQLKTAFKGFDILYSLKSNPNPTLAGILSQNCDGAEVTSLHELDVALRSGFVREKITYGGPGKSLQEFNNAIEKGIDCIDLESEREIEIASNVLSTIKGNKPCFTLRVNTSHKPSQAGEFMAGESSVFGIDEEDVLTITKKHSTPLSGIHAHVASQVLNTKSLVRHYRKTAELALKLSNELRFDLQIVNFGGGIGVPYSSEFPPIDIAELGELSCEAIEEVFKEVKSRPRLQLEIGRYLVAECGTYYTEIVDIKKSRGKNYIITDCGINGFSRPAMKWAEPHRCSIVSREKETASASYIVTGRSCLPSDILCADAKLPKPKIGDIIAVHDAGAYGYVMSLLAWSSRGKPKEVVYWEGEFLQD
jgi:diaminopimelate decarboxylase